MAPQTALRYSFVALILAVLGRSLMLWHSFLLTSCLVACSHLGWLLGRWIYARGELACQIARGCLMALTLVAAVTLNLVDPQIEMAALAHVGFGTGMLIALNSPRGGGRRSRRTRLFPAGRGSHPAAFRGLTMTRSHTPPS